MAQAALAALYDLGLGLRSDPIEAYAWSSLAASHGNRDGATRMAVLASKLVQSELVQATQETAVYKDQIRAAESSPQQVDVAALVKQ